MISLKSSDVVVEHLIVYLRMIYNLYGYVCYKQMRIGSESGPQCNYVIKF